MATQSSIHMYIDTIVGIPVIEEEGCLAIRTQPERIFRLATFVLCGCKVFIKIAFNFINMP